ncbi:YqaE/Pmp3 family membrane protein [Pontibacter chitinilyticus]|uniref:YqaE/Pmp3 family membrane protein n=1 Tax=Pontibacter chitinilyticus TaxID=2674989 RepID=UPI003D286818
MKLKSLLHLAMVLVLGQFLFACNTAKYYEFAANKPAAYNQKQKPAAETVITPTLSETALAAAEEQAAAATAEPVLEANVTPAPTVRPRKLPVLAKVPAAPATTVATPAPKTITEAEALAMAKERLANMTKAEKKSFKKEVKKELKEAKYQDGGRTSIVEIILAVLLPPLAVFLHDGIGTSFWISIILTLLFWIPGIIYALLVVTDTV